MEPLTSGTRFWDYVFHLRQEAVMCDIQLCVKDVEGHFIAFPAHKLVLVASSQYFQTCLADDEMLDVYNFDGISAQNLQVVLDYMYRQISWTDLEANAEAAVAAGILRVIQHEYHDKHTSVMEDEEGKKIMFVKMYDSEAGKRHIVTEEGLKLASSPQRPGRSAGRYLINSTEELEKHCMVAKQNRKLEKTREAESNVQETDNATDAQQVQESEPVTHSEISIDVSQLSLLADASMVQNRETVAEGETAAEREPVAEKPVAEEESSPVVVKPEPEQKIAPPDEGEAEKTVHILITSTDPPEPGEIDYRHEPGEIDYRNCADDHADTQPTTSKTNSYEATSKSAQVIRETVGQGEKEPTTSIKGPLKSYSKAQKGPQVEVSTLKFVQVDTHSQHQSPYGTRKKRITLPEALVKPKRAKLELEGSSSGRQNLSVGKQLESLLKRATPHAVLVKEEPGLVSSTDGHSVDAEREGYHEDDDEDYVVMEADDDDDIEYTMSARTTKKRVGRPRKNPKEKLEDPTRKQYTCSKCNKGFKNMTGLRNHDNWIHGNTGDEKSSHEGAGDHSCDLCSKVVKSYAALSCHKLKVHNVQLKLACSVCNQQFPQRRLLKAHQHKEHGLFAYTCVVCNATFRSREGWKIHMYKQHSEDEPAEMCQVCGKVFKMRHELRNHLKITHSSERHHQCHLCERAFKLPSTLKRHLQTYHSSMRTHECDVCKSMFKTKGDLLRHRVLHFREKNPLSIEGKKVQDEEQDTTCKYCGKVFNKRYRLKAHERIVHLEKQDGINYICTICNKAFAVKHYLMAHIAQKHRPRRYKCSRCQYEFSHPYMLRKHITKCKGYPISAKPFKCGQCGRSFNLKGNLTKHVQLGRCERAKNEIVDYVVVVQQEGDLPLDTNMENMPLENVQAVHDLQELQASQALQEMHGAAQIQGMQELQVQTTNEIHTDERLEGQVQTEEIILSADHHTTMSTAEDGTVIFHMLEAGDGDQAGSHVLQEATEQEVQTTILEIRDQEQLAQALENSEAQVVEIDENVPQQYDFSADQQNIIVQIIQAAEADEAQTLQIPTSE